MPSPAEMKAVMLQYVDRVNAGDLEGILALFAANGTVEDPVGSPLVSGAEALREFYTKAVASEARLRVVAGPYGSFGNAVAMAAEVTVPKVADMPDLGPVLIPLVEVMTFDDDCRITSMRAYWGEEEMQKI